MTDQPTPAEPTTDPAPAATEPVATAPEAATPPWGDDFDAEKAWKLVQNLRADKENLQKRPVLTDDLKQKLAEFDRLEQASKSDLQKAQEAAQKNAERAQALLNRAVQSEVKALASQGFADPEDAAAFLNLESYASESGDIDTQRIKDDLADLLARKPHLGKSPESRTPAPNPAQGSSGSGPAGAPPQLTEADVKRMYDAKDYAGIEKARQEGRLANLLGG